MSTARQTSFVSVDDYLAGEHQSSVKHEYVAGLVYAMVGAKNVHNIIASNALISLGQQLQGKPCRAFNPDTKIRIRLSDQTRFYYPDVSVVCRPNPPGDHFQDEPIIVFEVVSESTRRIDEQEKRGAYLAIPTRVLVESTMAKNGMRI